MLVPNLNGIMAKYGENTEKIVVDTIEKVTVKELHKEMGKEEVEVGKERKMKRRKNEEKESSGSEDEDFLSNEAFEIV